MDTEEYLFLEALCGSLWLCASSSAELECTSDAQTAATTQPAAGFASLCSLMTTNIYLSIYVLIVSTIHTLSINVVCLSLFVVFIQLFLYIYIYLTTYTAPILSFYCEELVESPPCRNVWLLSAASMLFDV